MSTEEKNDSLEPPSESITSASKNYKNNLNKERRKLENKQKQLQEELKQLENTKKKLENERAEFEKTRATVESELNKFTSGRVKVNVGGTRYETTLSTLQKYPDSMLGTMFSGRHELHVDDDGHVFIDRDGKYFGDVLNYLRDGKGAILTDRNIVDLKMINFELNYYGLPEIGKKSKNSNDSRVKLNVGGVKYETTLESLSCEMNESPTWNCTLGAIFHPHQEVDLDEEGCVFIDRDGKHFNKILNLLRDKKWGHTVNINTNANHVEYDEIKAECEYYNVW